MREYFYEKEGQQAGPTAGHLLIAHGVKANSLVWHNDMSGWAPASTVPELLPLFSEVSETSSTRDAQEKKASLIQSQSRTHTAKPRLVRRTSVRAPQFSASSKTTKWWHVVLYFIGCIVALLFVRACGVILAQLLLKL
ncbi:DUF4339 domain-containing protein [Hymenobacter nivis]